MTDLEISKALALAIGWHPSDLHGVSPRGGQIIRREDGWPMAFNYRSWNVIGPIAAKYNIWPYAIKKDGVRTGMWNVLTTTDNLADTPQKAIALAVIKIAKK